MTMNKQVCVLLRADRWRVYADEELVFSGSRSDCDIIAAAYLKIGYEPVEKILEEIGEAIDTTTANNFLENWK